MRNEAEDIAWIQAACKQEADIVEAIYLRHGHYDGGYEVRIGSYTFFAPYEVVDEEDRDWIRNMLAKGGIVKEN